MYPEKKENLKNSKVTKIWFSEKETLQILHHTFRFNFVSNFYDIIKVVFILWVLKGVYQNLIRSLVGQNYYL